MPAKAGRSANSETVLTNCDRNANLLHGNVLSISCCWSSIVAVTYIYTHVGYDVSGVKSNNNKYINEK